MDGHWWKPLQVDSHDLVLEEKEREWRIHILILRNVRISVDGKCINLTNYEIIYDFQKEMVVN